MRRTVKVDYVTHRVFQDIVVVCAYKTSSTRKEILDNAIVIMEWALKEVANGKHIASVNEADGTYEKFHAPVLITAQAIAQSR